ncbi:hypothetical protein BDQ17DRAFT_1479617, partial [Cyathus striatus]
RSSAETLPATLLASKRFTYPSGIARLPDADEYLVHSIQLGQNIGINTNEGPESMCQTLFLISLDATDFCLWSPPNPNSTVGDVEG